MCLPDCFEWLISHNSSTFHPPWWKIGKVCLWPAPTPPLLSWRSPGIRIRIICASVCVRHVSIDWAALSYSFLINLQHAKPMTATMSPSLAVTKGRTAETQASWTVNFNLYSNDILFLPFSILLLLLLPRVTNPKPQKSKVEPGTEAKTQAVAEAETETEATAKFKNNFPNLPQRFVLCLTHFHKARTETGIVRKPAEIIMHKNSKNNSSSKLPAATKFRQNKSLSRTLFAYTKPKKRRRPRCSPLLRAGSPTSSAAESFHEIQRRTTHRCRKPCFAVAASPPVYQSTSFANQASAPPG